LPSELTEKELLRSEARATGLLIDWKDVRDGKASPGLLDLVLRELFGRELAGLHVALVEFCILLPLLGKVVQHKNRGYRADWDTGAIAKRSLVTARSDKS
jgi:hypothetical protein